MSWLLLYLGCEGVHTLNDAGYVKGSTALNLEGCD